ncbi:MAG: hypothetical protein Q9188_002315 [Gyalolechia gomerana]
MGCAGIFLGALIIIAYSVPLQRRPAYTGLIGAMYGVALIADLETREGYSTASNHQPAKHNLRFLHPKWIGYEALFGLGSGLGMKQPLMAAQTVLPLDDVSIGTALVIFAQTLGGANFVSAAENTVTNSLITNLQHSLPSIDPAVVLAAGATALIKVIEG